MKTFRYARWVPLAIGLIAIVGLTGMNVYSLHALHDNTVQNSVEKQKRQLHEFSNQVRSRMRYPISELRNLEMHRLKHTFRSPMDVSADLIEAILPAANDRLFSEIHLVIPECQSCDDQNFLIWKFHKESGVFEEVAGYDRLVRDGLALAQTRMNALINDYRWNTRVIFDSHNSMTIAMVDSKNHEVIGYLNFLVDRDYLVNNYIGPELVNVFGAGKEYGIIVWLHDWTKNEVLASTDPDKSYSYRKVDYIQNFPDLLSDWNLKVAFTTNPDIAASRASLTRNLLVLGGAVLLLFAALFFIFFAAQRERALAQRQALFLANVTHELQTPLSVILAAGENLSDGRITSKERLKSYGNYIYRESIRLRTMIDRLLDVAKTNTNDIKIKKEPVHLADYTRKYLKDKRNYLESHQVELHLEIEEDIPEILIDPEDIHSILNNLLDNAIKYSPDDKYLGIKIYRSKKSITMEVEDRGIGIPRHTRKYIFEKFFRVEDALTAQTKGHGLGLAIVKDIMSRNKGSVRVISAPGKGTVFTLSFPLTGTKKEAADNNKSLHLQEPEHAA